MDKLNFSNIYVERLRQIEIQLNNVNNIKVYLTLINEKRCIEEYLKDKGLLVKNI